MEEEDILMLKAMYTMENGLMIEKMGKELVNLCKSKYNTIFMRNGDIYTGDW